MCKLRDVSIIEVAFNGERKPIAYGHIVYDDKGRFEAGSYIRTSIVLERGEDYIRTLNTRYEVESWLNKT